MFVGRFLSVVFGGQVCDGQGEPCDALCGGGGCGKCGALSCAEGAVTKSENALNMAREAETILRTRHDQAAEMMRGVRQAELVGLFCACRIINRLNTKPGLTMRTRCFQ